MLLLLGFRGLVDELHRRLADQGHPEARPLHGFLLQAIGTRTTAAELGRTLGISKQAAGKHLEQLERLVYACAAPGSVDARQKPFAITSRGRDCLDRSAVIFAELRDEWATQVGPEAMSSFEETLHSLVTIDRGRLLGTPAWFVAGPARPDRT